MKVATFIVAGRPPPTSVLFDLLSLDFLALTETWKDSLPEVEGLWAAHLQGRQTPGRHRLSGGISIYSTAPISIVHSINEPNLQALICQHQAGCKLGAIYIRPYQSAADIAHTLSQLTNLCRCRVLLLGDFNARHRRWDRATNFHGTAIVRRTRQHNMSIHAPNSPTFLNASTIDLFIAKATEITDIHTESGSWDTDHKLVRATIHLNSAWQPSRVPEKALSDDIMREKAAAHYVRHLPKLNESFAGITSGSELDGAVEAFISILHFPFKSTM